MAYIFGLLIAGLSLAASIDHLDQAAESYFDFVAVVMVVGGTFATAIITFPWSLTREIFFRITQLFSYRAPNRKKLLNDCMAFNQNASKGVFLYVPSSRGLPQEVLRDGGELMQLGLSADKIEAILRERVFQATERTREVGIAIRSLSKYPPAFGLAGTVLGLVHLMRGVSEGVNPQETGIRMAIALVATFYGLLVSNLIVNPTGEAISKNAHEEEKAAEMALQAVLLAAEKTNLLEAQEMLNSFVPPHERQDALGLSRSSTAEAEAA